MFIQVITAPMDDPARFRERWDAWATDCMPGAIGFRGGHGGVTPDGRAVIVAIFDDAASAQRNGDRPEQEAWWSQTESIFDGEPVFWESDDVVATHGGPTEAAGFVQVMHATCTDRAELEATEDAIGDAFASLRPDLLGALRMWHGDGSVTAVDFFSSLEEARAGEAKEPSDALKAGFEKWMGLLSDHVWIDVPDAWHLSR